MEDILGYVFYYGKLALQIIVAFGVVIFIHELGHFLVAKLVGVGATDFALGMGPEIFGFQWGETRCKLCLFPIGGYVNLVGEEDEDVPEELQHKSLRSKSTWQKIAVIFAGPFMNYVLAVGLFVLILMIWGLPRTLNIEYDDLSTYFEQRSTVVADFVDPRKPAGKAGIKKGDTILKIGDTPVQNQSHMKQVIQESKGKPIRVTIKRDFKEISLKVTPRKSSFKDSSTGKMISQWQIGIYQGVPTPRKVESVKKGSAAARAGVKKGDIILDFDKQDFAKETTYTAKEKETNLVIYRGKKEEPFEVAFATKPGQDTGLSLMPVNRRVGPIEASWRGAKQSVMVLGSFIMGLKMMINREVSSDEIAGPVGIVHYASTFARNGLMDFISFFAVISICLAVINLFPFPALDGSHIIVYLWEGITKRRVNADRQRLINTVGLYILLGLLVLITFKDLRMWLGF